MPNLVYTLPIPDDMLDTYVGAFALANGYHDGLGVTMLEFSRVTLNKFVENSISNYVANQAGAQARQMALQQTEGAVSSITTTLEVA